MSSDEMNQTSRRAFLARMAKTGAIVAPVIATFAMSSNSPVNARGFFPQGPPDPGTGNGGGGAPADPGTGNGGGGAPAEPGNGGGGEELSFRRGYTLPDTH